MWVLFGLWTNQISFHFIYLYCITYNKSYTCIHTLSYPHPHISVITYLRLQSFKITTLNREWNGEKFVFSHGKWMKLGFGFYMWKVLLNIRWNFYYTHSVRYPTHKPTHPHILWRWPKCKIVFNWAEKHYCKYKTHLVKQAETEKTMWKLKIC